jgi:hypothetical protein
LQRVPVASGRLAGFCLDVIDVAVDSCVQH